MLRKSIVFTPDFPNLGQPKAAITARWLAHWHRLRALKQVPDGGATAPAESADAENDTFDDAELRMTNARHRIQWRADRLVKARERAAGIGALKREILEPLREALKQGIALAGPASEHEADELAAALFDELPWMGAAIEPLWRDMRVSARQGRGLHSDQAKLRSLRPSKSTFAIAAHNARKSARGSTRAKMNVALMQFFAPRKRRGADSQIDGGPVGSAIEVEGIQQSVGHGVRRAVSVRRFFPELSTPIAWKWKNRNLIS